MSNRQGVKIYMKGMRSFLFFILVLIFCFCPKKIIAEGGSLSIFPQSGSFTVGNIFEASIFLNTGGNNVNAVEVDLKFDPQKLQVVTPTKGISIVGEWVFPPTFSNNQGTVKLVGGFTFDEINTSEGLITTIVFEAISEGPTEVYFFDTSKVLVGGEGGANILSSVNRGVYNILPPPFFGPKIFSETHPDQNKWYKNNSPTFFWERIEGAEGYSFKIDDDPKGEPDNNINSTESFISFEEVEDGIRYFHLKGKKDGVFGGTSHFKVNIDKTPPFDFELYLESFTFTPGNNLLVYFSTDDSLSGIDHYKARTSNIVNNENVSFSAWIRQDSPYLFSTDNSGHYELEVRAFDKAGNFKESRIRIRVLNPFFLITSKGVQMKIIFISWWQIYIFLTAILLAIGFFVFNFVKKSREDIRSRFYREVKEAEREIEDVMELEKKIGEKKDLEEEARKQRERLLEKLKGEKEQNTNNNQY